MDLISFYAPNRRLLSCLKTFKPLRSSHSVEKNIGPAERMEQLKQRKLILSPTPGTASRKQGIVSHGRRVRAHLTKCKAFWRTPPTLRKSTGTMLAHVAAK